MPLSLAPELFGSTDISWPALSFPTIKVCCAGKDVFQDCLLHVQRRQKEVWDGAKPQGIWGTGVPARSMGGAPVDGLGDEVQPQKLKNFKVVTSKFYAFLLVFNTFSPIYAYVFFCACRHHSTKSAKWGHLIPFAPLVCKWGKLPPLPPIPGSAAPMNNGMKQWRLNYRSKKQIIHKTLLPSSTLYHPTETVKTLTFYIIKDK